jgi:PLP dependent protein
MTRSELEIRLEGIRDRVSSAALRSRRTETPRLMAVTKRQEIDVINDFLELNAERGYDILIGENQVQEYRKKRGLLRFTPEVHMIGHLQTNKVRHAVEDFDVIQSVDSVKLAIEVDKEARKIGKRQKIFLQVNISADENKGGFSETGLLEFLESDFRALGALDFRGLMTITRQYDNPVDVRPDFARLRIVRDAISKTHPHFGFLELSMGMSDDFELAIEEGATIVRVGTALFGERE